MDYRVVEALDLPALQACIKELLYRGYRVAGGVTRDRDGYMQAMVKEAVK